MKELPILMTAPMVISTLNGAKTQTRRTRGLKGLTSRGEFVEMRRRDDGIWVAVFRVHGDPAPLEVRSPYGGPGGRLWVRETWASLMPTDNAEIAAAHRDRVVVRPDNEVPVAVWYRADGEMPVVEQLSSADEDGIRWRPSIYMPRWASRITLEVTDVRVERLQAITEADAVAEGVERDRGRDVPAAMGGGVETWLNYLDRDAWCTSARASYVTLWEGINGPRSWTTDPWVWVVSFRKLA